MKRLHLPMSLCLLLALSNAQAQEVVPKAISYMGYLADAAGEVVDDGDHSL